MKKSKLGLALLAAIFVAPTVSALAYDGTNCKAPGNCREPKPGFPEKIEGSKYDPKHDPKEIAKQQASIQAMEERQQEARGLFQEVRQMDLRGRQYSDRMRTPSPRTVAA